MMMIQKIRIHKVDKYSDVHKVMFIYLYTYKHMCKQENTIRGMRQGTMRLFMIALSNQVPFYGC